jgi:hypothetical protein
LKSQTTFLGEPHNNPVASENTILALQHRLEDAPQQIALAEAAMPVLGEGRVIRHLANEPEPAEPPVSQIEMDLFAQPPLRTDAEAVADDQHADHQLGINRGASRATVERRQLSSYAAKLDEPIDRAQQMIRWNVLV